MYNNQVMAATHGNVKIATNKTTSHLDHIGRIRLLAPSLVAATVVLMVNPEVSLTMLLTAQV
ncbi:hypothetical protein [Mastigocladopsis repens]|uniref:hypothetical protein n=1 Tax=Mastigocladopsis repens TaxID=221287 RepID=UPI0002D29FF0|nr:hypothetical protein [Mastigocladopsis repens]